jgi:peroxiredoxin family protein
MEQILELLKSMQQIMDDRHEEMRSYQAKAEASHKELLAKLEMMTAHRAKRDVKTMACQETMEACQEEKEPTSLGRKPEAASQEESHHRRQSSIC